MDNVIALLFLIPVGVLSLLTPLAFALRDRRFPTRPAVPAVRPRPVVAAIRVLREVEEV